jgi:hypothetical protein
MYVFELSRIGCLGMRRPRSLPQFPRGGGKCDAASGSREGGSKTTVRVGIMKTGSRNPGTGNPKVVQETTYVSERLVR